MRRQVSSIFPLRFAEIHILITITPPSLVYPDHTSDQADLSSSLLDERAEPRSSQAVIYDRTNPRSTPFRALFPQPSRLPDPVVCTAASTAPSPPSHAPGNRPLAFVLRDLPVERKKESAQVKGQAANIQSNNGQDVQQPVRLNGLQRTRLRKLGLTSEQAMRFACPWDMYLRRDNKRCTDTSCPFNHSGGAGLARKPLMCPFWGGKGGRHARCTKPDHQCQLAHYKCAHKQYGALPPGWVIRN